MTDLDPGDSGEVRRRVVDPVIGVLLHEGELESVAVVRDRGWHDDETTWIVVRALGEVFRFWLIDELRLLDARDEADRFYDQLQDFIAETRVAWGTLRTGDYVVPPPAG